MKVSSYHHDNFAQLIVAVAGISFCGRIVRVYLFVLNVICDLGKLPNSRYIMRIHTGETKILF